MNASRIAIPLLIFAVVVGCSGKSDLSNDVGQQTNSQPDSVDTALREARIEDAQRIARNALLESPNDPERLTDAARATAAGGDRNEAAHLLVEAAVAAAYEPSLRVEIAMHALLEVGEVYPAIDLLSQAVESNPDSHQLRRVLFGLLGETGRTDLMQEHFESIVRNRRFDIAVLLAFTDTSQRLFPAETMEALVERNPDDYRLRLGMAQRSWDQHEFDEAAAMLREIIRHHPDFAPAHALLGRMPSVQQSTDDQFDTWLRAAEPLCREQAHFWIAKGDRYFQSSSLGSAVSCYLTAIRIDSNLAMPWIQISRSIRQMSASEDPVLGHSESDAADIIQECDQRANGLLDLRMHLQRFGASDERSQHAATDVARSLNKIGRFWEAEAWSAIALTLPDNSDPGVASLRETVIANLKRNREWSVLPDLNPIEQYSNRTVPDDHRPATVHRRIAGKISPDRLIEFSLLDETQSRGLVVPEVDYPDLASALIDTMGSGGGTIDFDLDGWSDVVFSSSNSGVRARTSTSSILLRNSEGQFADVTVESHCGLGDFGQGIAIGDYNQDGFPDVFFANVGRNRLLRNNGDGTFSDSTASLGTDASQWTTGGAFIDMEGDGIPDLVAINYCDLEASVDSPCQSGGLPAPCHPAKFPADPDQLSAGDGRGGFRQSFPSELQQITSGRGLGILAGTLSRGRQSVFIANDMSPNHLLHVSQTGLVESAVPGGVAVDGQSLAQASMGIACGDFDGDLDLDLYVTGFAREYNIYYEQRADGFWEDNTESQGLVEPTLMTVGFGTQALDMNADGIDELAITNGHIGDFGPEQPAPAQRFQLMHRSQGGRFQLAGFSTQDRYLASNHIGRSLWKIDADRDLADDLIVTHQNAPPVLLVNRTKTTNHRMGLHLVGTKCSRDAIGAVVNFTAGGQERAMWLLSGDGYMSSNERILKAGIGASKQVTDLSVTWPDGTEEAFGTLKADQTHLLVQGSGVAFTTNQ